MAQSVVDQSFLDRSERFKGTRRAELAVPYLRAALLLAAQRDQRHLSRLRGTIARSPMLFAALQSDRLDPLLVAAVAGDGFMRDVAGHPARGGNRQLTAFDLVARDSMNRHLERCTASPDAAARRESRWASNRSCIRDGYLHAPLRALESTYGAACQSIIDARCGHAPLHAPPAGWSPGPLAKRFVDHLRVAPVVSRLAGAARTHSVPPEWIPPGQVRSNTRWWRHRWQAVGASRAQQLQNRSRLRVPISRWLFRRGMRRVLEAGPDAVASYLRGVAANPRRVAAARAEGLDPVIVAGALGPDALRAHVSRKPVEGRTNLHQLYGALSDVRERHLADSAVRVRGGDMAALDELRTPADSGFSSLYDNVLQRQAKAAGIPVSLDSGVAERCHALEDRWVRHHATLGTQGGKPPSLALSSLEESPFGTKDPAPNRDPSTMTFDDLVEQQRVDVQPESETTAPVPDPLVPPVPVDQREPVVPPVQPAPPTPVQPAPEPVQVSPAEPEKYGGRDFLACTVPSAVVNSDADATRSEDLPTVTLNPDGSYTVHDCPPVERVVPREDGSYRVYMTSDSDARAPRAAAATAEQAERRKAPELEPPVSREDVDRDFAKRFGDQLAAGLEAGTSVLDPPAVAVLTLNEIRGGNRGARAEPLLIGDVDTVIPGGPASFALAVDTQTRSSGSESEPASPLYVTEARLRQAVGSVPSGIDSVSVPDPWGSPLDVKCFAVEKLPAEMREQLPSMPKVPSYDVVDAAEAPAYDHYVSGAVRASGIGAVGDAGDLPNARPAFESAPDGGRLVLYSNNSIGSRMNQVAESGDMRPVALRKRVAEQIVCESANLRVCLAAVTDVAAGRSNPSMPAADRELAAELATWQLARRTRLPYHASGPPRHTSETPDPLRKAWTEAARDPNRMSAILDTASEVGDTLLREGFAERSRKRTEDRSRTDSPSPRERAPVPDRAQPEKAHSSPDR